MGDAPGVPGGPSRASDERPVVGNSVFDEPWWLDAVAPGAWDAVECRRGDELVARMPYVTRRRGPFTLLVQAPLTPRLGPWIRPTDARPAAALAREKELLEELITGLPPFDHFEAHLSPDVRYWLPFHWAGFTLRPRVTYRFDDLSDIERLWADVDGKVRRRVRKARERLEVRWDVDLESLLAMDRETYRRQGLDTPYDEGLVRRIHAACQARGAGRVLAAVDGEGRVHAAQYLVWDERDAFLLMSAQDRSVGDSAAPGLLVWEAVTFAATVARRFDFEGSMLPGVERFLRGFGGVPATYLAVSRTRRRMAAVMTARDGARAGRDGIAAAGRRMRHRR